MGYNDEPYRVEYIWVCQKHSKTRWLAKRPSQSSGLAPITHVHWLPKAAEWMYISLPMANNWVTDDNWLDYFSTFNLLHSFAINDQMY